MSDDVRLRATRDIPGVKARLENGYSTRRLKAGDIFYVAPVMANLIVNRMGRAEFAREPGKLPKPPAALRARLPQLDHDKDGKEGGSPKPEGDLSAKRAEYLRVVGKRAFNGWDEAEMDKRIAAAAK